MDELVSLLIDKQYTICSCESLTGGLFCSDMTEIPGVSKVFKGGIVSYWNQAKENVVGVNKNTINDFGVVSYQTAYEMALKVKEKFCTNIAVSFTGNAGPDTLEGKPKGLVYTCIIINDEVFNYSDLIDLPRNQLREKIVELVVKRLIDLLKSFAI